jgi:hypothetical protein
VHKIDYALLDGKSGTEVLQKHPHPTINSRGGREGWVGLGVSIEAGKQLECSIPHDVGYEPVCDAPCVYAPKNSYSDTNAEELALTATETQVDPSKGSEDKDTARMFKLECHHKELDQCSIYMKRLIAMNTFKTNTGSYEGFSEQYVQEVLDQFPSRQGKKPMEETRQPQDNLGITGTEALANAGPQGLPFQSHNTFHVSQDARIQDATKAMDTCSSREQVQEQITCPKEAKGNSQDSGYSTALEAMVKCGQMSPPYQAFAITAYLLNMPGLRMLLRVWANFLLMNKCKNRCLFPRMQRQNYQDSSYNTTPEAMIKFGQRIPPSVALAISLFPQVAKTRDAPEAMVKFSSPEHVQEEMTLLKEAHVISQESRYNTAPDDMVKYGQTSLPSQALATSPLTQDARNQDAPEAVPKSEGRTSMAESRWTILHNKAAKVGDHESNTMQDSNTIM